MPLKLASGELHPLQISFASDQCVFPLKISSVNGKSSEVQVYVLSPEPLLEKTMFEKKLPLIYSNDMAQAARNAQSFEQSRMMQQNIRRRIMGAAAPVDLPASEETLKAIQRIRSTPAEPAPEELPPYAKVTKTDLPDTSQWIPGLTNKSWWLTKETWTFQPEEMRDLEFEPTLSVFAGLLGTKYGYIGVEGLTHFQSDAVPVFLAAFQNTNPVVRISAASIFNRHYGSIDDPRLTEAAVSWLKDPEPEVRMAGVNVLTEYINWNPKNTEQLVAMLYDKDPGVRGAVIFALPRFRNDLENNLPTFEKMLRAQDPNTRAAGLEILQRLDVVIRRVDLLPFFKSSDAEAVSWAFTQLMRQGEIISDDEAMPLLQNPQPVARQLGLQALSWNPGKPSVELALPLLRDTDEIVRLKATQTLCALTGQRFSEDQADEWAKWWTNNKTNFVAKSYPQEPRALSDGRAYHDRGCDYYDTQDFAESLADFQKSRELGSEVQDYSCYRIWLIRARSGEKRAATQELVLYLKQRQAQSPPDWPLQIGRFLTGQISEADLLAAATSPNSRTDHEQHCEAYFYAGSKRLIEGDRAGAADLFNKCLGTEMTTFEEYRSTESELKLLR